MQSETEEIEGRPLTYEQLWGVPPPAAEAIEKLKDFCPQKKIRCPAWDNGCQVEKCFQNA